MIPRKKSFFIQLILICSIFILKLSSATALKNDSQQPVQIDSAKQSLDLKKNITTFTKNVAIKQGTIDVRANKVVVTCPNGNTKKMIIETYGTPATFYQLQDNGKPIKGHSDKIRYEIEKELVTLTGNAYFEQLNSNIKGDKITYLVPTQQMKAYSNKGKQVTTILLPSQLQKKIHSIKGANNSKSK